jgi:hypothetical protein
MPSFVVASSSTIFLFPPKQNMYWNTSPSWSSWNYLSNDAWNGFRTREMCQFYSGDAICPKWFQTRNAQCFCHISLYGSSQLMILDALEIRFEGASEYYIFFHCTYQNMCSNLDGNNDFSLKPCRWLTSLIAIGQELMRTLCHAYKTNQMHILPPGRWSGVETIANKPNASLRP